MLGLALTFFDKPFEKLFFDAAAGKITDALDRRNFRRQMERVCETSAQSLQRFFLNEGLKEDQADAIMTSIQQTIQDAEVDAKKLATASLDAEKLTDQLLAEYPIPPSLHAEDLDWPYRMALTITAQSLCHIGPKFAEWELAAWSRNFEVFDY